MAVRAASFRKAAGDYQDAVGAAISHTAVWRIATGAGALLCRERKIEAERANTLPKSGVTGRQECVPEVQPIEEQANISSDGVMILVQEEGWKEVKIAACSRVQVASPKGTRPGESPGRRDHDLRVALDQHSYVAGLWDADEFAPYQYAEGLRRGLGHVKTLTSVNDGAAWIKRVTQTNFPKAIQIVDWAHASGHLHATAGVAWGEGNPQGTQWVEAQLTELWHGRVEAVIQAIERVKTRKHTWPDDENEPTAYFTSNADRMRYDDYRREGYPIGSGTVESSTGSVVQSRMCRPGRGWRRRWANGMLALLCEYHSDRFMATWHQLNQKAA